jgi:Na+-driven multidrug efflux pump
VEHPVALDHRVGLLALALDAIAIAGQAITGRYLGAGDTQRTRAATTRMIAWGAVCGVVFGVLLIAVRPVLPAWFAAAPPVPGATRRGRVMADRATLD